MKYLVIGAGGTGGVLGYYLTKQGYEAEIIARGTHLKAIREKGLTLKTLWDGKKETVPVKASSMEEFSGKADVIFVCVKGYSLPETIPFLRKVSHKDTVIIPILNIYGTGERLSKELPGLYITDGCIYVSANIEEPGTILMHGSIRKVVFGPRPDQEEKPVLREIARELCDCGVEGILSPDIRRDALKKFSYVSPIGAAGLYFHAKAADFQKEGEPRRMFAAMIQEIERLGEAMGIAFDEDPVALNLKILSGLSPEATTSMQRDVMAGKPSEIDGLVFEVVRLGRRYQVDLPNYQKAAKALGYREGEKES